MLYTLLKNERIVTGPRDWNPRYFEYFIQQDCGIETSLPNDPIVEPIILSDTVKLLPTLDETPPTINPLFETLVGPKFKYGGSGEPSYTVTYETTVTNINELGEPIEEIIEQTNTQYNNYIMYYDAEDLSINTAKNNLKQIVANNRWTKENASIDRQVGPYNLTIYTDRGSRTAYTQALVFATDTYSAQWKFPQGFVTLNKAELQTVVDEVVDYVQSCFDWESDKVSEIDSKTTIEELEQIILE
jgi:hypothetical protein